MFRYQDLDDGVLTATRVSLFSGLPGNRARKYVYVSIHICILKPGVYIEISNSNLCVRVHICNCALVVVRGQLTGICSFYYMGSWGQTQIVRIGGKCLYLLSHLNLLFFNNKKSVYNLIMLKLENILKTISLS